MLRNESKLDYFCDNLEIFNKLNIIQEDPNTHLSRVNTTDHDAISIFPELDTPKMKLIYAKSHQDERKQKNDLTLAETFNITADGLISISTRTPISTHILYFRLQLPLQINKYQINMFHLYEIIVKR